MQHDNQQHHTAKYSDLHVAVKKGNLEKVQELCTSENVNDTASDCFFTPLYLAAISDINRNHVTIDIILYLLSFPKCDINKSCAGVQPIFIAALKGNEEIVKCLLSNNAKPDPAQLERFSPVFSKENPRILSLLQRRSTHTHAPTSLWQEDDPPSSSSNLTKRTPHAYSEGTEMVLINNMIVKN